MTGFSDAFTRVKDIRDLCAIYPKSEVKVGTANGPVPPLTYGKI